MFGFSHSSARAVSESEVHRHCPAELADEFSALDPGSPEVECLEFLYALTRLFKPSLVLETGTGIGWSTYALASALERNRLGSLHTVELDAGASQSAADRVRSLDKVLLSRTTFHVQDSLSFLAAWPGPPFDFALFDSLISLRFKEFQLMQDRQLLAPKAICVFHDTSRLRGVTMHDFDPDVIAALDQASLGQQWLESELSRGLRLIRLP